MWQALATLSLGVIISFTSSWEIALVTLATFPRASSLTSISTLGQSQRVVLQRQLASRLTSPCARLLLLPACVRVVVLLQ